MNTPTRQINAILATFDFDSIQRVMAAVDWRWGKQGEEQRVPSVEQLRTTAREMLDYVVLPSGSGYIASGGLVAQRYPSGFLKLAFEVESAGAMLT